MTAKIIMPKVPNVRDYLFASILYIYYDDMNVKPEIVKQKKSNLSDCNNQKFIHETIKKYNISPYILALHCRCQYIEPIMYKNVNDETKIREIAHLMKNSNENN